VALGFISIVDSFGFGFIGFFFINSGSIGGGVWLYQILSV
jgi:hypothetical protein